MSKKKTEEVKANYIKVKYMQLVALALSEFSKNTDTEAIFGNSRAKTIAKDLDFLRTEELPQLF